MKFDEIDLTAFNLMAGIVSVPVFVAGKSNYNNIIMHWNNFRNLVRKQSNHSSLMNSNFNKPRMFWRNELAWFEFRLEWIAFFLNYVFFLLAG